jgi:hypothetical protein
MANIGIEYIENFAAARAAGVVASGGQDLTYVSDVAEGLREALECKGHTTTVSWIETDVFEVDLRAQSLGGIDQDVADKVDLFLISTHGDYDGAVSLLYNSKVDKFLGTSAEWRLGDTCALEWLLIFGCHSIDRDRPLDHLHIFQGLHLFCGAYGDMFDSFTIDEAGEDVGDNLTSCDSVKDAWCDGVSDWFVDKHPAVVSVETEATYNGGNIDWANTVIESDHLWGHGTTRADVKPDKQYWMAVVWEEG